MGKKRRRDAKRPAARSRDLAVKGKKAGRVKGGQELLVTFQPGQVRPAYVIGGLWNGKDKPPTSTS
jgi:hypothetical protein